ncbi:antigen like protein, partial [Clarias magur]
DKMPGPSYSAADDGDAKAQRESGGDTTWSRWSKLIAACLVLLCVILLIVIIVLSSKDNNLKTETELQTSNNNLTIARDQFQREREQLQRERAELERFLKLGWTYSNSSVYIIINEQKSWTESRQNCIEREADLVIINSKEEQEFVTKLRGSGKRAWIGLRGRDRENKWKWVDDTTLITG